MDNNLKIHFYLKSGKLNVKGQVPIYLRLTLKGQRAEISINQSVSQDSWNKHTERIKGNREEARILNNMFGRMETSTKLYIGINLD